MILSIHESVKFFSPNSPFKLDQVHFASFFLAIFFRTYVHVLNANAR